ncbi:MAG TPA: hypothetical protein VGM84_13575 [Steroidobacteraceae bacterium]|jgi:hypothetical protein
MSYRDDFYTEENILGYTGDLKGKPTIYFADAGGVNPKLETVDGKQKVVVTFGHITQFHDIADNVGRELVREAYSYTISNVMYEGEEHAQECVYGLKEAFKQGWNGNALYKTEPGKSRDQQHLDFHISRNRFEQATAGTRKLLAMMIPKTPDMKKMYEKK